MSWSALPIELTTRILKLADPTVLVAFRRVNSFFKSLIDETTTLQYRIALFASGMVDGPPGELTTSERLELLRKYEASWKNIEWNEDNTVTFSVGPAQKIYGNVWAHSKGRDAIDFIQLPSRLRGIPMRQWTAKFGFDIQDFGMDPSQDLLVTVETNFKNLPNHYRIQLRTLSSGEMHPLAGGIAAMEYTLRLAMPEFPQWSYSIQICGDYLGILFKCIILLETDRNELVVWSWRTGVQYLSVLSANVQSFVFLDNNFILASTWTPTALLVYELKQTAADDTTHLLRFLFGTRFENTDYSYDASILLTSNASLGYLPNTGKVPFHIASDERMIAMYSHSLDPNHWFDVTSLIPATALLRQIESIPDVPVKEGLDVEWEECGLQLLEYVPEMALHTIWNDLWQYFVGMRYLRPATAILESKTNIIIRDLSPRRWLRASKEEHDENNALEEAINKDDAVARYFNRVTCKPQQSILKCVPLPEDMKGVEIRMFLISEDGIVIFVEPETEGLTALYLIVS